MAGWNEIESAAANARLYLPPQAGKFFRAGRKLAAAKFSYSAFHGFRLRAKRFRYTLEFFRFCYGPGLDELLGALRSIQDDLGAISDCETAVELAGRLASGRKAFEEFLLTRAERKAALFRRHWNQTLGLEGAEARWAGYLGRPKRKRTSPHNPRNN